MNKDDIIRMAREAGFVIDEKARQHQPNCVFHTHYMIDEPLERFAALVAAAELRQLHEENRRLREQLRCDAENMEKGMSKSMQKLCARSIRETLRGEYD